jgi:threonyl-tRNA synthetase
LNNNEKVVVKLPDGSELNLSRPASPADAAKVISMGLFNADILFERNVITKDEAIKFFGDQDETYKIEIIEELEDNAIVTAYKQGSFTDLCRGPHLPSTGKVKSFKLQKVAGAYWRGDSDKKMLSRISSCRTFKFMGNKWAFRLL